MLTSLEGRRAAWHLLLATLVFTLLAALVPPAVASGRPGPAPGAGPPLGAGPPPGAGPPSAEVTSPTSSAPALGEPGDLVHITFTANRAWSYALEARDADTPGDDWVALGGDEATGTAVRGENMVEIVLPEADGLDEYDLRLQLSPPGSGAPVLASDTVEAGLRVAEAPTTGFEDRDGDAWTTHDEEMSFLEDVAAVSPRVTYTEIGRSHQDRPLHLVRVGGPVPPSDDEIAQGKSVLVIASQHGDEPAGREMALQLIRDLAYTQDRELVEQLGDTTVLLIPNANPDGAVLNQRENAAGVDLNRGHLELEEPETQAIASVLRDFRPDISIDAHEAVAPPDDPDEVYMLVAWQRNLNVYSDLYELNVEMVEDYLFPGLESAGFSEYGLYGSPDDGQDGPWFASQNFGLRHGLGILAESWRGGPPVTRVAVQMQTALEILRFQRERSDEVADVTVESALTKAAVGAAQSQPFYLSGADWDTQPPPPEHVLFPPPCGYLLDEEQEQDVDRQLDLFAVETEAVGDDDVFVTMGQPMMTVVPDLLDERARQNEVAGQPLQDCSQYQ